MSTFDLLLPTHLLSNTTPQILHIPKEGLIIPIFTLMLQCDTCRLRVYTNPFATTIGLLLCTRTPILIKFLIIKLKQQYTEIT